MRPRIEPPLLKNQKFLSICRGCAGPFSGVLAGAALGGLYGALVGLLFGFLIGDIIANARVTKRLSDYLRQPLSCPDGPLLEEPFPGACALAGFAYSFGADRLDGGSGSMNALGADKRAALLRLILEKRIKPEKIKAFMTMFQAIAPGTGLSPRDLLRAYLARPGAEPELAALSAWAICGAEGLEIDEELEGRIVEFLVSSGCGRECALSSRRSLYPDLDEDWRIMGLARGASAEEVKKSYRSLSLAFHPDGLSGLSGEQREKAQEAYLRVRRAYENLQKYRRPLP
jgi:hypothetical protein